MLTTGVGPLTKAAVPLTDVEREIASDCSSKKLFSVLEKHWNMKRAGRKLKRSKDILVN